MVNDEGGEDGEDGEGQLQQSMRWQSSTPPLPLEFL